MNLYEIVRSGIVDAQAQQSKITWPILQISGMSSPNVRHFLNSIIKPETRYVEVGCWRGSTFVSALWNNTPEVAFAIDNWSEFNDPNFQIFYFPTVIGSPKDLFHENTQRFLTCDYTVIESDCFAVDLATNGITDINTFFFDGAHDYESQRQALTYYYEALADEFIFIVDDWNNDYAQRGTMDSIEELGLEIVYKYIGPASMNGDMKGWWNGMFISILRKGQAK